MYNKNKIKNSQYINYKNRKIAIIDNVNMPNEIDSSGIAYQISPNEINIANNNVWAYSLSEQITDQLITQLNNLYNILIICVFLNFNTVYFIYIMY